MCLLEILLLILYEFILVVIDYVRVIGVVCFGLDIEPELEVVDQVFLF